MRTRVIVLGALLAVVAPFAQIGASNLAASPALAEPVRAAASVVATPKAEAFWGPCRILFFCHW